MIVSSESGPTDESESTGFRSQGASLLQTIVSPTCVGSCNEGTPGDEDVSCDTTGVFRDVRDVSRAGIPEDNEVKEGKERGASTVATTDMPTTVKASSLAHFRRGDDDMLVLLGE